MAQYLLFSHESDEALVQGFGGYEFKQSTLSKICPLKLACQTAVLGIRGVE